MHELSIARNIVEIVEEEMTRHGIDHPRAVNIAVGKFAAIAPQQLAFCFTMVTVDTRVAGAVLNIREVPPAYTCAACGKASTSEDFLTACPACGAEDIRLTSGRELTIESIEV